MRVRLVAGVLCAFVANSVAAQTPAYGIVTKGG